MILGTPLVLNTPMRKSIKVLAIVLSIAIVSDIGIASALESAETREDCLQKPVKVFAKALNFSRKHRVTPFSQKLVKKVAKKVRKKPCLDEVPAIEKPIIPPVIGGLPVAPLPIDSSVKPTVRPLEESSLPGNTVMVPSQGFPIYTGIDSPQYRDPFYNFNTGFGFGFGFGPAFWPGYGGYFVGQYPVQPGNPINPTNPTNPITPAPIPVPAPSSILLLGLGLLALAKAQSRRLF